MGGGQTGKGTCNPLEEVATGEDLGGKEIGDQKKKKERWGGVSLKKTKEKRANDVLATQREGKTKLHNCGKKKRVPGKVKSPGKGKNKTNQKRTVQTEKKIGSTTSVFLKFPGGIFNSNVSNGVKKKAW